MNIILPVSHADSHLLEVMLKIWDAGYAPDPDRHRVIVVATHARHAVADKRLMEKYVDMVLSLPFEPTGGWPSACNIHFLNTAIWVRDNLLAQPWYWMELDTVPTSRGWADLLERMHIDGGKRFMGMNVATRKLKADGTPFIDSLDAHMVGTGIYPPDSSDVINAVTEAIELGSPAVPWDIAARFITRTSLTIANSVMSHRWGTVGYSVTHTESGSTLNCSNRPANPPGANYAGPIALPKAVVHGCKDDSLARLVLAGQLLD